MYVLYNRRSSSSPRNCSGEDSEPVEIITTNRCCNWRDIFIAFIIYAESQEREDYAPKGPQTPKRAIYKMLPYFPRPMFEESFIYFERTCRLARKWTWTLHHQTREAFKMGDGSFCHLNRDSETRVELSPLILSNEDVAL